MLFNFCNETLIKFLNKNKENIQQKEAKEMNSLFQKIKEGLCKSFFAVGTLFYSKEENEVKNVAQAEVNRMKEICKDFKSLKQMHTAAKTEIVECNDRIAQYEETCIEQSLKIDSQAQLIAELEEQLNIKGSQLNSADLQLQIFQDIQEKYQQSMQENNALSNKVNHLQIVAKAQEQESIALAKALREKEKEMVRVRRMV